MVRPVVLVTRRLPEQVEASLRTRFDVRLRDPDTPMSPGELASAMRSADAVLCTVTDSILLDDHNEIPYAAFLTLLPMTVAPRRSTRFIPNE